MYENPWLFQGREFQSEDIGDNCSFVYLITNTQDNKRYIGKKQFYSQTTKPPLKGQKRKRKVVKESDWQTYYGSNKLLNEDVERLGTASFTRQILILCKTKSEASYWETRLILEKDALIKDGWYNDWLSARFTRKHLTTLRE
jgi:hypothetical protein